MQIEQTVRNGRSGIIMFPWGRKPVTDWNFHPYFYVPEMCEENLQDALDIEYNNYIGVDGVPLRKIICKESQDVSKLRGDIHYEASTPYTSRYWIDKVKEWEEEKPRICAIDIEAASVGNALTEVMIKEAPDAIIIIGIKLNDGKVIQFCWNKKFNIEVLKTKKRETRYYKTEKQMAYAFIKYLVMFMPEIIVGFNILGYDIPYILNRFKRIGVNASPISPLKSVGVNTHGQPYIKGVALFDLFLGYINIKRKKFIGNKLDDVLERELGIKKYSGVDASQLKQAWESNPEEVLEYNYHDVYKMMLLDKKLEILDTHIGFHNVYGCNLSDTLYPGKMLEHYMSRRLDFIYPSTKKTKGLLKGAEPKPPVKGIHENVLFVDLTSAYPFGMISANMSIETKVDVTNLIEDEREKLIDINGTYFLQPETKKGEYVKIIEELFEQKSHWGGIRDSHPYKSLEWKNANAKRNAFKVGINTIYGLTGDVHSKFYDVEIANAVTAIARGVIKFTTAAIGNEGHKYIMGHTDSVGFQLVPKTSNIKRMVDAGNAICESLNKKFPMHLRQYNVQYEHARMNIDFERIAKIGIFSGKTRYAIKILWADGETIKPKKDNSDIEMKGWDAIRSDSSIISKELQKKMIEDVLNKKDRKDLEPFYIEELKKIKSGSYPLTKIGVPAEFKKKLSEYPSSYYRSVGAKWSNEKLDTSFGVGTKPFFIKASAPEMFGCPNYVAVDSNTKIPDWLVVDYNDAMEKTKKKLGYVYDCLGYDVNSLTGQRTLEDF